MFCWFLKSLNITFQSGIWKPHFQKTGQQAVVILDFMRTSIMGSHQNLTQIFLLKLRRKQKLSLKQIVVKAPSIRQTVINQIFLEIFLHWDSSSYQLYSTNLNAPRICRNVIWEINLLTYSWKELIFMEI